MLKIYFSLCLRFFSDVVDLGAQMILQESLKERSDEKENSFMSKLLAEVLLSLIYVNKTGKNLKSTT